MVIINSLLIGSFFLIRIPHVHQLPSSWYRRGAGIPHGRVVLPGFAFFATGVLFLASDSGCTCCKHCASYPDRLRCISDNCGCTCDKPYAICLAPSAFGSRSLRSLARKLHRRSTEAPAEAQGSTRSSDEVLSVSGCSGL